ncbi:hypothetical protein ACWD0G_19715 [Streptomyces goshikiensis]
MNWSGFGDLPLREAGTEDADLCMHDWGGHVADVAHRAILLPPDL